MAKFESRFSKKLNNVNENGTAFQARVLQLHLDNMNRLQAANTPSGKKKIGECAGAGVGVTVCLNLDFRQKFPIGLHVILQIQIRKFKNDCYIM